MLSLRVIDYFRLFQRFYLWLAVAFVLFIGWKYSSDIGSAFRNLNAMSFNMVIFGVTLAFFSYSCRTLRWLQYMQLKQNSASLKYHILIYFSGFAFTVTPCKTGELMRGAHLSDVGVPFRFTFCAFFSERLLDVIAVSLLGSYFFTENYSFLFALIAISIVFFIIFVPFVFDLAARFISKVTLLDMSAIIDKLWKRNIVAKNIFYSLLSWLAQGLILYLVLKDLGVVIKVETAVSIYCLSLLFGAASFIPSGIGVTEVGMVWLLTRVGVDSDIALMSSLFTRMITLWPSMLVGLVCSYHLKRRLSC